MERRSGKVERRRIHSGDRRRERLERLLREHAESAREAELNEALRVLAREFEGWHLGRVTGVQLIERLRQFQDGPARDLDLRYSGSQLSMPVAHAIATGVLDRRQVPRELLNHLEGALEFYTEKPIGMAS